MVFYDLSSSYFEGEGPEESAGFGNGPDGSGGLKEKRFGLAPDGLCSGTGGDGQYRQPGLSLEPGP